MYQELIFLALWSEERGVLDRGAAVLREGSDFGLENGIFRMVSQFNKINIDPPYYLPTLANVKFITSCDPIFESNAKENQLISRFKSQDWINQYEGKSANVDSISPRLTIMNPISSITTATQGESTYIIFNPPVCSSVFVCITYLSPTYVISFAATNGSEISEPMKLILLKMKRSGLLAIFIFANLIFPTAQNVESTTSMELSELRTVSLREEIELRTEVKVLPSVTLNNLMACAESNSLELVEPTLKFAFTASKDQFF
ncbi:MAG: hypothetical protein EZS28_015183 [Streblomastix strix]|uniref:Uncharacterized protein n=1 Tax=Streblomastix strix TaxID=222440 RepID=A0A5J4W2Y5_9EUKA|nr:MAG: hypothetical protein EZS28_015183 [Streblomastix strix]